MSLSRYWYVVGTSDVVSGKPVARELLSQPMVLFRDASGAVKALAVRCPHRNYPLSLGRLTEGKIRCTYHGWEIDGAGKCVAVPGLDREDSPLPKCRTSAFATVEQDGLVWVWARADEVPPAPPPAVRLASDRSYHTERVTFDLLSCSFRRVLENFMDSMHPPYVHPGLLNSDDPAVKQHIRIRVSKHDGPLGSGIGGAYLGEKVIEQSLLLWLFADRGTKEIEHAERYLAPAAHQIEFRFGGGTHFVSTQFCTPETETTTRLTMIYHFRLERLPHFLARWPLKWFLVKLLGQDMRTLAAQQKTIERTGGPEFASTKLDALGLAMSKFLDQVEGGRAPADVPVHETTIPMWI